MTTHYLVTGGAGFIGTHLVERLLRSGFAVTVLDDFSAGDAGRLAALAVIGRLRVVSGDIRDRPTLQNAMTGTSGVFHLAARVSVADCIDDWLGAHGVNATAMPGLLDTARNAGGLPVVYASSAAVYGDCSPARCHENMAERPISPYGADKLSCEHQARAFWAIHRVPSAGLRFFNVYGPGQDPAAAYAGVISRFATNSAAGLAPVIHGDGRQSRDFVHVLNAVDALVAAMDRISATPQALISSVCTGTSHSVLEVAALIADLLGMAALRPAHRPGRAGEIRMSCGDPAIMTRTLKTAAFLPLRDGLAGWIGTPKPAVAAS